MRYLNTRTGEYPRYAGDVALAPNDAWEIVEDTEKPELGERQVAREGIPEKDGQGIYRQTWVVSTLTQSQWDRRRLADIESQLAVLGFSLDELKSLLAEGK